MGNVTLSVMKKEIKRIFYDRKLLFAAVILPGLLIFVLMNLTGTLNDALLSVDENHIYEVHAVNLPDSIAEILAPDELRINIVPATMADTETIRQDIADQNTDLLIIFPQGFDVDVAAFNPLTATAPAPNVEIWSNTARQESAEASSLVTALIGAYHHSLTHRFSINAPTAEVPDGNFDLATAGDIMALLMGMMLPMFLILFIFTGCQSLVPESVSGEKERGTLGTLLVTTASRKQMALGKVLGLSFFAMLGALGSFIGLIFSMGNMIPEGVGDAMNAGIFEMFSVQDFLLLFLIATSLSLLFVSLLSIISTYAKSVKEANAFATPLIVVIMVGAMGAGFIGNADSIFVHMIPVFNSSLGITAIVNSDVSILNTVVAIGTNFVLAMVMTGVVAAMFSSEKIVFD